MSKPSKNAQSKNDYDRPIQYNQADFDYARYQTQYFVTTTANANWPLSHYTYPISSFFDEAIALKEKSVLTDQQAIDAEVKEAITKPRREAEIARRVVLVEAILTALEDADAGTVLRFKRIYSKKEYTYAAVKAGENWYLTGTMATVSGSYTDESLLEWMTTGETTVFDVEVVAAWSSVA